MEYKPVKRELVDLVSNSMDKHRIFVKPLRLKNDSQSFYLVPAISVQLDTLYDDYLLPHIIADYLNVGAYMSEDLALLGTYPEKCKLDLSLCFVFTDFVRARQVALGLGKNIYSQDGLKMSTFPDEN